MATTPQARCASWSIHQFRVSGSPVASSLPNEVQYPSPLMFSFGIDPSMTSTNGSAASPRAAARNGVRNSSPPSVGLSTLLWRLTLGRPGMAPSSTSSMLGWPAAVTDTESPSQLIPSEIQRMSTSSTPATGYPFHRQGVHERFFAADQLYVQAPAAVAGEREAVELRRCAAPPARAGGGDVVELQRRALGERALGHEREGEVERVGYDLAQVPDLDLDAFDPPPVRVGECDLQEGIGDRELVHQQILGSGSPTSSSSTRLPPKPVSTRTMPGGSVLISPISWKPSTVTSGATIATNTPSLATYSGSMPSSSHAPATAGATGMCFSLTSIATFAARASSLSTEATPPRVASRITRTPGPRIRSTSGHSDFVSETMSASSSNSPRASMIAVPCAPIGPESRMRSPGRGGEKAARGSRWPRPVVVMYRPSACPRSTTLVSPPTIRTPAVSAARARASTSSRSVCASSPSSRMRLTVSATGRAPAIARSLTVPLTASSPIDPPGKRRGLTTKASVVIATSPIIAASSSAIANAGCSSPSTRREVALPPAPWAIVIRSSRNFARLALAVSMISSTRAARAAVIYTTWRSLANRP